MTADTGPGTVQPKDLNGHGQLGRQGDHAASDGMSGKR